MTAAIYARQSLDKTGEGQAVERQLSECRRLATSRKIRVVHEFIDNDVSASKGIRPEYTRMLSLISAGEIDTIITWHTDRLYRRVRDLVDLVEVAEKHALQILTVKAGEIDLTTPAGRMAAGMLGHVARYEVEQKGARQAASNVQRARNGVWQFSNRPYGYERTMDGVQVVAEEAGIIREAYDRFLAGESLYGIVDNFNERNIATTTDRPWSISTLSARLSNPAYAGLRFYRGEEVAVGDWEPIVPRETWEAFKASKRQRRKPDSWSNRTKYLLSGLALCGVCGGRLMARPDYVRGPSRARRVVYACSSKWCVQRDQTRVDELVEEVLVARLSQPDASRLLKPKVEVAPLHERADDLRRRRDDLAAALSEGLLSLAAVRTESRKLTDQLNAVEKSIAEADDSSGLDELLAASDVRAVWGGLSLSKRRATIDTLMTVAVARQKNTRVFDPADVQIEWRRERES
ncbi:recombinase family protein [Pseudolysinimonas kribbensis]